MFRRFGSQVTVVQRGGQLLPLEDADVAAAVLAILREDGVEVLLESKARSARCYQKGVGLVVTTPQGERSLGQPRAPRHRPGPQFRTAQPGRCRVGKTDAKGFITVNERLETSTAGVFALGDVKGGPAFTHISYDDSSSSGQSGSWPSDRRSGSSASSRALGVEADGGVQVRDVNRRVTT